MFDSEKVSRLLGYVADPNERELLAEAGISPGSLARATLLQDDTKMLAAVRGEAVQNGVLTQTHIARLVELDGCGLADEVEAALEDIATFGVDTRPALSTLTGQRTSTQPATSSPLIVDIIDGSRLSMRPRARRTIIPGLERGSTTVLAAPGGGAKSALALTIAVAIVREDPKLLGHKEIKRAGDVLIVSNEDGVDDQLKRIQANARYHGYKADAGLKHRLQVLGGAGSRVLLFERDMTNGPIKTTPVFSQLLEVQNCCVIVIDTLASACAGIDENDSSDMTFVMSKLQELARKTDAAVLVLHHVAKGAGERSANAVRGSSAIVNSVRTVIGLSGISEDEVKKLGTLPADARSLIRAEVVKGNHTPSHQPHYFRKRGQNVDVDDPDAPGQLTLENIVVLEPVSQASLAASATAGLDFTAVIETLRKGYGGNPAQPFLSDPRSGARSLQSLLENGFGLSREAAKIAAAQMIRARAISETKGKDPATFKQRKIVIVADDAEARLAGLGDHATAGFQNNGTEVDEHFF